LEKQLKKLREVVKEFNLQLQETTNATMLLKHTRNEVKMLKDKVKDLKADNTHQ
jgi:prefoldin subunit 5